MPPRSDDAVTLTGLRNWLPPIVTAGGLLVAGIVAVIRTDTRIAALEATVQAQATQIRVVSDIEPRLARRFTAMEQLLVEMICTQTPQDPDRCRRATRIVGGMEPH